MMPFQELLKRPLLIYLAHFGTFFKIIFIPLVFNVIINVADVVTLNEPININRAFLLVSSVTLISILLAALAELALVRTFFGYMQGETPSAGGMLSAALKKLPGFVAILVLWFLAVTVGFIFLIVPAIIFATWFMFLSSVYMIEGAPTLEVFRRSKNLVSPHFVSVLWRITLASVIFVGVLFTASRGIQFILELLGANPVISYNIVSGVSATLGALLLPVYVGVIVTMYLEIRNANKPL